jgi:hypothetical protein
MTKVEDKYDNLSEKEQIKLIKLNPYNIKYIKNPSIKSQELAIKKYPYLIKYIKNQSEEIQEIAINKNIWSIKYIDNPTKKIQEIAINKKIYTIFYIKNPDENIVINTLLKFPWIMKSNYDKTNRKLPIDYFNNLSYNVQSKLIENNINFVYLIKNLNPILKEKYKNISNYI